MPLLIFTRIATATLIAFFLSQSTTWMQVDTAAAIAAASGLSRQVSTQEWLGPLSAIALSPFFGLACLSGIATYGPDSIQSRSALFGETSPLNNPVLFWLMAGLTIATSVPRYTKVSKPIGLAVEKLEAYSVIIILIAMKFLGGNALAAETGIAYSDATYPDEVMMTAGFAGVPFEIVLSIAAALNIIVVNTIKLAVEVFVWLIPFPTVDALLEIANKSMCAAMMALYAYSPLLATGLNLCILGACCLVFFRVKRILAYMKELFLMPLVRRMMGWPTDNSMFCGFLTASWNGLPARAAIWVSGSGADDQVQMRYRGWLSNRIFSGKLVSTNHKKGLVCDQMAIQVDDVEIILDVPKGILAPALEIAAV